MLRRRKPLRRLVCVALVVGVAVFVVTASQLFSDGDNPTAKQHLLCKYILLHLYASEITRHPERVL